MPKDKKPTAKQIWKLIESNLDNRGCFNGIDEETMRDLRREQLQSIAALIGEE